MSGVNLAAQGFTRERPAAIMRARSPRLRYKAKAAARTGAPRRNTMSRMKPEDVIAGKNRPFTGTVLKKNVDPQHYAGAGEDLYDVADLSTIWMVANAYEFDMQWLKLGQNVTATTDAYPGVKFSGAVNFISPMIDPATRTLSLRAEFSNPGDKLKPGMYVDAFVNVTLPPAVVVPATALLSTGTRTVVWVQKGPDIFLPRLVQPGARAGERVQILEGISEGERVVTSGGYSLDSESELQAGLSAAAPAEREPSRQ